MAHTESLDMSVGRSRIAPMEPTTTSEISGSAASAVVGSSSAGSESYRFTVSYWTLEQAEEYPCWPPEES